MDISSFWESKNFYSIGVGYFSPRLLNSTVFCSTIKRSDCLKTTKFQNILRMIYFDIVVNLKDHPTGIMHASLHRLLV